jgi:hypothetical protein
MFVLEVVQLRKIVNNNLRRLCNACHLVQTNLLQPSAGLAVATRSAHRGDARDGVIRCRRDQDSVD